jgi:hypothetical protein
MSLISITYFSMIVGEFVASDIVDLAERASAYNTPSNVTGFLCQADGCFLQSIEGDAEIVNRIYHSRILPSRRHREPRLLLVSTLRTRHFSSWAMGFANVLPADRALLLRYFPRDVMEPDRISGEGSLEFLQALSIAADTFKLS